LKSRRWRLVILVNIYVGTPFFMIIYLAALKSAPAVLYEVAAVDGASAWQKLVYVTLPMMRNIIAITVPFSLIVTFANYDIVRVLTSGGPRNMTHILATYAFRLGVGQIRMLLTIFIPVAMPGIVAATIVAFTVSWGNFLYPMAFIYSTDQLPLTAVIVTTLIKGDVFQWGTIVTGALLASAPPVVLYAFLMDCYIAGLTTGATKG